MIEKVGAFDPLGERFKVKNNIYGSVAENPQRTGFDACQISTEHQAAANWRHFGRLAGFTNRKAKYEALSYIGRPGGR